MEPYARSYDVRELRRRLPDVSEVMLNHFLDKYNNDVEEVYRMLKDGRHHSSPHTPENFDELFTSSSQANRTAYGSPHSVVTEHSPSPNTERYPLRKYPTYGGPTHSTTGGAYQQYTSPLYGDPSASWPDPRKNSPSAAAVAGGVGGTNSFIPPAPLPAGRVYSRQPVSVGHDDGSHRYPPPRSPVAGRLRESAIPEYQEVELQVVQRRQLENMQKVRDEYVHEISRLRSEADNKKHKLTKLRLEVSEGTTRQDVSSLQDVITTLQYDQQVLRNKTEVERAQVEMKDKKDVYTDEGVRWPCQQCTFLNHPLMTRCESCDLPKENDT